MCFSSLPVLSFLILNHNRLADVADMRTTPATAAVELLCGGDGGEAVPLSTIVSNAFIAPHVSISDSTVSAGESNAPVEESTVSAGESNVSGDTGGGGGGGVVRDFPALEAISLSGNKIHDWSAVDRLSGLPVLRSLRFSGNPVTSGLGASEVSM